MKDTPEINGEWNGFFETTFHGSQAEKHVVLTFASLAWYNALELIILCFLAFKRYRGCYFASLLTASLSIVPFTLGYVLILLDIFSNEFTVCMALVGWVGMVTGQSLVLWSRLNLLVHNKKVLRGLLVMIIVDAVVLHTPSAVTELGLHSARAELFAPAFNVIERVQLVGFSVQEIILSVIYAWEAVRLLNLRPRGHYGGILVQLLVVNVSMILMDAAIIGIQNSNYFTLQVITKAFLYSVKLKMEYAILGRLVDMSNVSNGTEQSSLPDFIDFSGSSHQETDPGSQRAESRRTSQADNYR